jgi:hypothetical protein
MRLRKLAAVFMGLAFLAGILRRVLIELQLCP